MKMPSLEYIRILITEAQSGTGLGNRKRTSEKNVFYNLPSKCQISVWTLSGDLWTDLIMMHRHITEMILNGLIHIPTEHRNLPAREHAWDLISQNDQAIASGLYMLIVKDLNTGKD